MPPHDVESIFMALVTDSIEIFIHHLLVSHCPSFFAVLNQNHLCRSSIDENGRFIETGMPPPPNITNLTNWMPFKDCIQFEIADLLYMCMQLSASQINALVDLLAYTLLPHHNSPPFTNFCALYNTINDIPKGDIKWQCFKVQYTSDVLTINPPPWMQESYEVWYCDVREVGHQILGNPSYADHMDFRPFQEFSTEGDHHQYQDFMFRNWAWTQAVSTLILTVQVGLIESFIRIIFLRMFPLMVHFCTNHPWK